MAFNFQGDDPPYGTFTIRDTPEVDKPVIPLDERVLLELTWTDCTNVAGGWHDSDDLGVFAVNGAWETTNTGWLVWEDDHCYVLAGRMTTDGRNVGLLERVPKTAVTARRVLARGAGLPGRLVNASLRGLHRRTGEQPPSPRGDEPSPP